MGECLVHGDRENKFIIPWRHLYLIENILSFLGVFLLQILGLDIIDGDGDLLVFVIAQPIVVVQVRMFLRSDHSAHEFHGRISLPFVMDPMGLDDHFRDILVPGDRIFLIALYVDAVLLSQGWQTQDKKA